MIEDTVIWELSRADAEVIRTCLWIVGQLQPRLHITRARAKAALDLAVKLMNQSQTQEGA